MSATAGGARGGVAGHIIGETGMYGDELSSEESSSSASFGTHAKPQGTDAKRRSADAIAIQVLRELCRPMLSLDESTPTDAAKAWSTSMDDEAEERRRELFRTQYRAVESEVVGLAVKG